MYTGNKKIEVLQSRVKKKKLSYLTINPREQNWNAHDLEVPIEIQNSINKFYDICILFNFKTQYTIFFVKSLIKV